MFTLYYLNKNLHLGTIKVATLDAPVLIPEDLVFCNFRSGVKFIKEPHECIDFTDTERLLIASEFSDMSTLKDYDFRRANTYLNASCSLEQAQKDPRECDCGCGCDDDDDNTCSAVLSFEGGVTYLEGSSNIVPIPIGDYEGFAVEYRYGGGSWESTDVVPSNAVYNFDVSGFDYGDIEFRLAKDRVCFSNEMTYNYKPYMLNVFIGGLACHNGLQTVVSAYLGNIYSLSPLEMGSVVYDNESMTNLLTNCSILNGANNLIYVLNNMGVVIDVLDNGVPCTRLLGEIEVSAVYPNTVEIAYNLADGSLETQTWVANGTGEEVLHTFSVGKQVSEPSISVTGAVWSENHWLSS